MKMILVIEDGEALRDEIVQILECLDYEVMVADNGTTGVDLAKRHLPDVILCDVMMPGLDGYGVFTMLRQDPGTATIPFIFLSAMADRASTRQAMNLGADDYLTKPFTSQELAETIAARLQKKATLMQPYITQMQAATDSLNQLAYRDPLTQLPNRIMVRQQLHTLLGLGPSGQSLIAVLCLKLHRFRQVNANLGYTMGDQLLQAVAERLQLCVGRQDTVGRLAGEEFALLLAEQSTPGEVASLCQTILEVVAEPYKLSDRDVSIQSRIGIALYPQDGTSPDQLLHHADVAAQFAQDQGGNYYQFYQGEMAQAIQDRQLLAKSLGAALEHQELQIYYQPQMRLATQRVGGAEALLRWQNPQVGLVNPDRFLAIAEETGLILPIGEWVLRTACQQLLAWQSLGLPELQIAVNLSARQLYQPGLVQTVIQVLETTGLETRFLTLEITETSMMVDIETSIAILNQLRQLGIRIALDDFGTGYSSLNYLKRLPIDILKIDPSFIRQLTPESSEAAIITAILALASRMNLKVIAEGVETPAQLEFLQEHQCHAIQGHLFQPPLPRDTFEQLFTAAFPILGTGV